MNCYAVHMPSSTLPTGPRPPKAENTLCTGMSISRKPRVHSKAENTLHGPCHKKEKHRGVSRLPLCFSCFPVSRFLIFTVLYFYFSLFFTVSFSLFPYISLISMRLICGMRISGIVKGWSGFAAAAGSCPSPGEPLLSGSPLPGL